MTRIILLIVLFLALGGGYYAYKMYNKEHINVEETEATQRITSAILFQEFESNKDEAQKHFVGQIIEVSGKIVNLDLSNTEEPQLVLEGNGVDGFIRCGFKQEALNKVYGLKDSTQVTIKGECIGINDTEELDLLMDVEVVLSNCIIIE
jgi:hydrogenase maturation factor HypE